MVTWWWVRHGPTHRRDMVGWTDAPADLSDTDSLGRLSDFLPAASPVISSDLSRAVATADAIQRDRPRLPNDPGLREIHFGEWEGRNFDQVSRKHPDLARSYWETPGDVCPPGGESWNHFASRVARTVDRLSAGTGDIIAVAHFGTILSQVQRARACTAVEVFGQRVDNLSVTRIRWEKGQWQADIANRLP